VKAQPRKSTPKKMNKTSARKAKSMKVMSAKQKMPMKGLSLR